MSNKWSLLVLCVLLGPVVMAGPTKDAEAASHGDSAAFYQEVRTYTYPGFQVVQLTLPVLSHYSYILTSRGQALVVDPGRDIDIYLETTKKLGVQIKGVFLTHSHADFVAGHLELANATGCPIYVNQAGGAAYKHEPLQDGSTLTIGDAQLKFIATPGHTPDGLCAAIYGTKKAIPEAMFTGDTLFVGSVGRPDLLEGKAVSAATLAGQMFDTWTQKLAGLGDTVVILPAHGAGSLCGAHLSDEPFSTIGAEKVRNSYLQFKHRNEFIAAVLEGLPEAPQYFKYNAALNKQGPNLVDWQAPLPQELSATPELTDPAKHYVVDLRSANQYATGHLVNSVNIGLRGRLETWVGIMVPWAANLTLLGNEAELKEAIYRLHRVGYHANGIRFEIVAKSGLPLTSNRLVKVQELHDQMQKGGAPVIVDVRLPNEWLGVRIGTVVNLPLNHLDVLSAKLDETQPVITVCNSAYRSSMAMGILERKGFKAVANLNGGSEAWIEAGLPVYGIEVDKTRSTPNPVAKREIKLAERMSANDLQRLLLDLPNSFDLVDIRSAAQFNDYNIPGSVNVELAEVLNNPAYLVGVGPLIIVDRDGSLAMMVAGILSQKTQRPVKALYGGLEAFWGANHLQDIKTPTMIAPNRPDTAVTPPASQPKTESPQPPKKKSAGC